MSLHVHCGSGSALCVTVYLCGKRFSLVHLNMHVLSGSAVGVKVHLCMYCAVGHYYYYIHLSYYCYNTLLSLVILLQKVTGAPLR